MKTYQYNYEVNYADKLIKTLNKHKGKARRIGMGELYQAVYGGIWRNRINDTRSLRKLITHARKIGHPICSSPNENEFGYWLAKEGKDLSEYCANLHKRALKILAQEARLRKINMPRLIGQMALKFKKEVK